MTGPLFRSFWLGRDLLNPYEHGFYSFQLISHKLLRRLVFVPFLGLAVTAPGLRSRALSIGPCHLLRTSPWCRARRSAST